MDIWIGLIFVYQKCQCALGKCAFQIEATEIASIRYAGAHFAAKNHKGPNFLGPNLPRTAERHAMVEKQSLFVNFQMLTKVDKNGSRKMINNKSTVCKFRVSTVEYTRYISRKEMEQAFMNADTVEDFLKVTSIS